MDFAKLRNCVLLLTKLKGPNKKNSIFGVVQTALNVMEPVRTPIIKQRKGLQVLGWVTPGESSTGDTFFDSFLAPDQIELEIEKQLDPAK